MFGLSGEHLLVLLVILLIFGPKRLPDLGHSIGRTLKNFKDAMNGGNTPGPGMNSNPSAQIPSQSNSALRETAAPASTQDASAPKQTENV